MYKQKLLLLSIALLSINTSSLDAMECNNSTSPTKKRKFELSKEEKFETFQTETKEYFQEIYLFIKEEKKIYKKQQKYTNPHIRKLYDNASKIGCYILLLKQFPADTPSQQTGIDTLEEMKKKFYAIIKELKNLQDHEPNTPVISEASLEMLNFFEEAKLQILKKIGQSTKETEKACLTKIQEMSTAESDSNESSNDGEEKE